MSRESVTVNPAAKRLERDLAAFHADEAAKKMYHIEPESDNDIFKLKGYVYGPPDTPYQGGTFHLTMTVPSQYPFKAPTAQLTTKVYHPNIGFSGTICLDTMQSKWTPAMSIRSAMMSIQGLLSSPNSAGLNGEVSMMMATRPEVFKKTAAFWTYHYAVENKTPEMIAANEPLEAMVEQVMAQLNINYDLALAFLSRNEWNIGAVSSTQVGKVGSQSSRRRRGLPRRRPSNSDSN